MKDSCVARIGDSVYISDNFITIIPVPGGDLTALCCTDTLTIGMAFRMLQVEFERSLLSLPPTERRAISEALNKIEMEVL